MILPFEHRAGFSNQATTCQVHQREALGAETGNALSRGNRRRDLASSASLVPSDGNGVLGPHVTRLSDIARLACGVDRPSGVDTEPRSAPGRPVFFSKNDYAAFWGGRKQATINNLVASRLAASRCHRPSSDSREEEEEEEKFDESSRRTPVTLFSSPSILSWSGGEDSSSFLSRNIVLMILALLLGRPFRTMCGGGGS